MKPAVIVVLLATLGSSLWGQKADSQKKVSAPKATVAHNAEPATALRITKNAVLRDDFRSVSEDKADSGCPGVAACALLLGSDAQTKVGEVNAVTVSPDEVTVTYTQSQDDPAPSYIRLGRKSPNITYDFAPVKPPATKQDMTLMEQAISGDFCQKDENCNCTTELLKQSSPPAGTQCAAYPKGRAIDDWHANKIAAYVLDAEGSRREATLKSMGVDVADVSFSAPSGFKPAQLVLWTEKSAYPFAYAPALPVQTNNLNYTSDDLETVCDTSSSKQPDCEHTDLQHLAPKALSLGSDLTIVAIQGKLLIVQVKAPLGLEPTALIVTNTTTKISTVVRRTIKPGQNNKLLRADMTIMDQGTVERNYGKRIAKRYLAINLDVKNPTSKKLQFKKSAIYFDVDYAESEAQDRGFVYELKATSSLGLWPGVYRPPFAKPEHARVARFGIEQNVKHSPITYMTILGSFDHTTEATDKELKLVELLGSLLTNISTGGMIATGNNAFRDGTALFAGTFLPGLRSIVLNTPEVNRKRTNLVAQTLQEVVEVPAGNTASTVVLLPRMGILAFTDAEVPVIVDRVLDVHLEPEVVTELNGPVVLKNSCKVGYTKDETREALGEPTGVSTNADNTSAFTFSKGAVASAVFDEKGLLVSCTNRSASDQLDQTTTLVEAIQMLTDLGLPNQKLELTDGSVVLAGIPKVQKFYHFSTKGERLPDYTPLLKDIQSQKGQPKSAFVKFLQEKAAALSAATNTKITEQAGTKASLDSAVRYESPEFKDAWLLVKYKASGKEKDRNIDDTSLVDSISFEGAQPKSGE